MPELVNPAQIKDFGRNLGVRTQIDDGNSWVLARYGALLNPRPRALPATEARVLQGLLSQCERNRLEKATATKKPSEKWHGSL
jgi:transposase